MLGHSAFSTHNRAGEILFKHIFGTTYEVSVVIYADPTSPAFTRKEIEIDWGDNTGIDSLNVSSENNLNNRVNKRIWISRHTFPGPGNYTISVTDLNRNAGVKNIENSSQVPFYVETLLRISPFAGDENNSVILLNDPIDEACMGQVFIHNPGAYDPDGDSLAYEISSSKTSDGLTAPGFQFPPTTNSLSVDPLTGDLIWDVPNQPGQYNLAILIKEYRNDILLAKVLRDMQIEVNEICDNFPPDILTNEYYCVEAGKELRFNVRANDRDNVDKVSLSATGGPFVVSNNPANFNVPPPANPISGIFRWNTLCEHRRASLYNVSFKAVDNADERGSPQLSTFKSTEIKIIAPAPKNFSASAKRNAIELNWSRSFCEEAIGYKLYRRRDSSGFVPDSCTMGVPEETGFVEIAELHHIDSTFFLDDNNTLGLVPGQKYCYIIIAYFEDGDESYASEEICASVEKFTPVITQVSVDETHSQNGKIKLRWSPPNLSVSNPDPLDYRYLIYKSITNSNYSLLDSTLGLYDTLFMVESINTLEQQHFFKVELYKVENKRKFLASSTPASSLFLKLDPSDRRMDLNWTAITPWNNYKHIIYRQNPLSLDFDSIGSSSSNSFSDTNLTNEKEYCYLVQSIGDLQLDSVPSPILNFSQEACDIPLDKTPPCPPTLSIDFECEAGRINIFWELGDSTCSNDITSYKLYKSNHFDSSIEFFYQIDGISNKSVVFDTSDNVNLAGCYAVTALDSNGNESIFSDTICLDVCPIYRLPNVFTPNSDDHNNFFIPFPYQYVDSINLQVFNRWGQLVFKTKDPDINWGGTHYENDELLSAGTYYYVCIVYEQSLYGTKSRTLKGTLNIIDPQPRRQTK